MQQERPDPYDFDPYDLTPMTDPYDAASRLALALPLRVKGR